MMPWRRRVEAAHAEAVKAREALEQARRQRDKVDAIAHDVAHLSRVVARGPYEVA